MRYMMLLLTAILLAGCDSVQTITPPAKPIPVPGPVTTIGPLKIVTAYFDYHQTLERPDGTQFEFNHCAWVDALAHKGRTVEITYTGDYRELIEARNCAKVVSVKVIPRKGHWVGKRPPMKYIIDGEDRVCGSVDAPFFGDTSYPANGPELYEHYLKLEPAIKAVEEACK